MVLPHTSSSKGVSLCFTMTGLFEVSTLHYLCREVENSRTEITAMRVSDSLCWTTSVIFQS